MSKDLILYKDDGSEKVLPFRWAICGSCEGHGKTSRHVECDGGGFTSSEWAEQDDEFKEDYIRGRYDRPCASCSGTGKVKVADRSQMSKKDLKEWRQQCEENRQTDEIERQERLMGA